MIKPIKQHRIQIRLQLADLGGDGGLGIAQLLRRRRKAGIFAHSHKGIKHMDIHKAHLMKTNFSLVYHSIINFTNRRSTVMFIVIEEAEETEYET